MERGRHSTEGRDYINGNLRVSESNQTCLNCRAGAGSRRQSRIKTERSKRETMRTLHAVPQHRNGDCDPHEAQIDIPVNLPRTSFALPLTAHRSPLISVLCTLYSVLRTLYSLLRTLNPNKHEHSNKIIHSYTELERGRHDASFPAFRNTE